MSVRSYTKHLTLHMYLVKKYYSMRSILIIAYIFRQVYIAWFMQVGSVFLKVPLF